MRSRGCSGSDAPQPEAPGGWDEDSLARRFRELAEPGGPELALGIGDDAAVLRPVPGEDLVWTVDALEEDVDFRRAWLTPREIGARAVAAALSDLAAMGARPIALQLGLGSDAPEPGPELLELFEGALAAARDHGAAVAGGDLTRRARGLGISVAAVGAVPLGGAWTRAGGRAGDELWVTGVLGLAARGLALLERGGRAAERDDPVAVGRWVRPAPRLAEARWLRERVDVHAAIDLSDGLALDLTRLCAASGLAARLDEPALRMASVGADDADLSPALEGGEDFELLLAAAPGALSVLAEDLSRELGTPLRRIGSLAPGKGVRISGPRGERSVAATGWDHVRGVRGSRP